MNIFPFPFTGRNESKIFGRPKSESEEDEKVEAVVSSYEAHSKETVVVLGGGFLVARSSSALKF